MLWIKLIALVILLLIPHSSKEALVVTAGFDKVVIVDEFALAKLKILSLLNLYQFPKNEYYALVNNESGGYIDARPPILKFADGSSYQENSYGLGAVKPTTRDWIKTKWNWNPELFGDDLLNPVDNAGWTLSYLILLQSRYSKYAKLKIDGVRGDKYLSYVAYNRGPYSVDTCLAKGQILKTTYASRIVKSKLTDDDFTLKKGYKVRTLKVKSKRDWYTACFASIKN